MAPVRQRGKGALPWWYSGKQERAGRTGGEAAGVGKRGAGREWTPAAGILRRAAAGEQGKEGISSPVSREETVVVERTAAEEQRRAVVQSCLLPAVQGREMEASRRGGELGTGEERAGRSRALFFCSRKKERQEGAVGKKKHRGREREKSRTQQGGCRGIFPSVLAGGGGQEGNQGEKCRLR